MDQIKHDKLKLTLISAAALVSAAVAVAWLIFSTEPQAQREGASKKTPMLVDTLSVERGRYQPLIVAMGEVVAEHEVEIRAQVAGRVVRKHSAFAPGVFVSSGTPLLEIEKQEFELAVQQSLSELMNAQAMMAIERGEQAAAKAEYEQLKRRLDPEKKSLVLREPQLQIAQARLSAAQANHARAQLELQRSKISAPFNAQVVEQRASVGTLINEGDSLGRLVGTDRYWVEVQVPMAALNKISLGAALAQDDVPDHSAVAEVRDRLAWEAGVSRPARVHAAVGELNRQTRMARLLLVVEDPLSLKKENSALPRLMPGAYVQAHIKAKMLDDVVRLPRAFLRQNDSVWVMKEGKLDIRNAEVLYQDPQYAYIAAGLENGDKVVTSALSRVRQGAELRVSAEPEATPRSAVAIKNGAPQ